MSQATTPHHPVAQAGAPDGLATRRAALAGHLAAAWSLLYGGLALGWALHLPGWPARPLAGDLPAVAAGLPAALRVAVGLAGAGVAVAMANGWGRSLGRRALLVAAWGLAGGLLLGFTTQQLLVLIGYAPIYLIGAPFGWPPDSFFDHVTWAVVHEALVFAGALLWARAALGYQRRGVERCARCGLPAGAAAHAGRVQPRDRWAVAIAMAVPLLYAATRYAWLLGLPLGISEEFLREGQATGLWVAGAGLATFAAVGALLTLGLVQRWGEVLPRWVPLVGGRRVPPALAVVPATTVSLLLVVTGVTMWRGLLAEDAATALAMSGSALPVLLLPVWGAALGFATHGYRRRRAVACPQCPR